MADELAQTPETPAPATEPVVEAPAPEPASASDSVRAAITALKGNTNSGEAAVSEAVQRVRDDKGRFVTSEAPATPPAASVAQTDKAGAATPRATSPAGAPAGWTAEAKAEWSKLSPSIHTAVAKREQEFAAGIKAKSDELRVYQGIDQIMAPRRQMFAEKFGYQNDGQVITHLLTFADAYVNDPAGLIRHLAKTAGLNLNTLAAPAPQTASASPAPTGASPQRQPDSFATPADLNRLKEQIRVETVASSMLQDFAKANPHYEKVRQDMALLMDAALKSNRPIDLARAYEMAVASRPDIAAAQSADREAAEAQARAAKTAAAGRAAISPRGGSPAPGMPARKPNGVAGPEDARETVRRALGELSGRA